MHILAPGFADRRAWQIFRETYHYPTIPFKNIGRPCFGWALSEAYRQAREAARFAAIPATVKAERAAALRFDLIRADYIDNFFQREAARVEIKRKLSALVAA